MTEREREREREMYHICIMFTNHSMFAYLFVIISVEESISHVAQAVAEHGRDSMTELSLGVARL